MPAIDECKLTRREKRTEAKEAVRCALECADSGVIRVHGQSRDLYDRILRIVQHYGFAAYPLDRRDIQRALQSLHKKEVVKVWHIGPKFDRTHGATLLRRG